MADKRLQVILDLKDRMSGKLRKPVGGLQRLDNAIATTQKALTGFAVISVAKATWELGELGARSKDVKHNLESFAGGAANAEKFMNAVVSASDRSVDRMTASSVASRMLQMGLADSTDEMALYVEGAVRLGDQTQSSSQRIGEMTQFLKNLNINMADNFGLSRQVLMSRVRELKATQGLSREEAMLIAIKEELNRQLEILGPRAEDGAQSIDQLKASMTDLKVTAGEAVAPAVVDISGALNDGIPVVTTAANQIATLTDAGLAWAGAALTGEDATNAFNDAILRNVEGLTTLGVVVRDAQADGVAFINRLAAMDAASAQMAEAQKQAAGAIDQVKVSAGQALGPLNALLMAFHRNVQGSKTMNNAMLSTIGTVRSMTGEFIKAKMSMLPDEAIQMWGIMRDEQQRMKDEFIRNAVMHGRAEEDAADKTKAAWSSAYADAQAAAAQFDSEVQSLFQSTMNVDVSAKLEGAGFRTEWATLEPQQQRGSSNLTRA